MKNIIIPKRDLSNCAIDLFAGCGGFSLGFIKAGWKILAALELNADASATYWYNLCWQGWSHLWIDENDKTFIKKFQKARDYEKFPKEKDDYSGWIYNFEPPSDTWLSDNTYSPCLNLFGINIMTMEPEEFMEICGIKPGEIGAIIGGPPCQGFSIAGERNLNDARNQLVYRFLYYASVIKPRTFLIENVPGILSLGKKKGEKEGPFPIAIRETANKFGYHLDYDIHNAKDFGVPQTRKRVLFVGVRDDLYKGQKFKMTATHNYSYFGKDNDNAGLFDEKKEPYVTVFEAIGDLMNLKLSSWQDKDAIKKPLGDRARGYCYASADVIEEFDGRFYYKDRFNGLFSFSNDINDYDSKDWTKDHIKCIHCGKFNLKIRTYCHYCHKPKSIYMPESEIEVCI